MNHQNMALDRANQPIGTIGIMNSEQDISSNPNTPEPDNLEKYGWTNRFDLAWKAVGRKEWLPGRVLSEQRHLYQIVTSVGELKSEVSGKFRAGATGTGDFPAVGDWGLVEARPQEGNATIQALDETFHDIHGLAEGCRFRDCKHLEEPGCAVLKALRDETLDGKRYESYYKLERELRFINNKKSHSSLKMRR